MHEQANTGAGIFQKRLQANGKLKIGKQQEYTNEMVVYFEIESGAKRTDIALSVEFLSDLPAMKEHQASVDEYVGWLETRFENPSPRDFQCSCGRAINVEIYWPRQSYSGRSASYWKIETYDLCSPELIAKCAVIATWATLDDFKGIPFRLERAVVNTVRRAVDSGGLLFFPRNGHPLEFQQVEISSDAPSGRPQSLTGTEDFLLRKVYWLALKRGDQRTKVWITDPWDADYLGVSERTLVQAAQVLQAKQAIILDSTGSYASAGNLLLVNSAEFESESSSAAPRRIGFI